MLKAGWRATRANATSLFHRPQEHFAAIDGVRALSQMAVMLYHCFFLTRMADPQFFKQFVLETPVWLGWVWTLDYSVDAFFVISGYLIADLLFREHCRSNDINLKRFYSRRYLRLTPAYFSFILLFILLNPRPQETVWANFLYLNNFIPLAEASIPWSWSLAVEEQFYLIFPAILLWFVLKGPRPVMKLAALLLANQLCAFMVFYSDERLWNITLQGIYFNNDDFNHYYDRFYVNLYTRFGPFICGALLACLMTYHRDTLAALRENRLLFNCINLIAIGFIVVACGFNPYAEEQSQASSRWHLIANRNLFGLALAWLLFAVHDRRAGVLRPLKSILEWKSWYPIAQLSYCMYLFHYPVVIFVMSNVTGNLEYAGFIGNNQTFPYVWMLPAYLVVILLTLIPAVILHIAVEKPFMQLRDSFRRKPTSPNNTTAKPPIRV